MNKHNEKLENGFSLYINGPEMTKKTKTGLWPTPTKTLVYQFASNVCTPFKKIDKNFPESKPHRLWNIDGNTNKIENAKVTPKTDSKDLFEQNQQPNLNDSPIRLSQVGEISLASSACKNVFLQILSLDKSEKQLILEMLSKHLGEETSRKVLSNRQDSFSPNLMNNTNTFNQFNPFISVMGPTFSGKKKTDVFCETKTFWEEFDNSTISREFNNNDSTTEETSDIYESLEMCSNLNFSETFIFEMAILTNWGGNSVGFNKIEVISKSGGSAVISNFRIKVQSDSDTENEYFVNQRSVLTTCLGTCWKVVLFASAELDSPVGQVRIWNYCDRKGEYSCGIRNACITINSEIVFTGEIPRIISTQSLPFIIRCKN